MAYPDYIDAHERRIITKLIKKALGAGYRISVYDGEEYALKRSTDFEAITAEVAATDITTLRFRLPGGDSIGAVMLVHGNGEEVISDYTDNKAMSALVEGCE